MRRIKFLLIAAVFVWIYVFVLSLLEWMSSPRDYDFWKGFGFSLIGSALWVILVYGGIALVLHWLGINHSPEKEPPQYLSRIVYKDKHVKAFVSIDAIQFLAANDNYVSIYTDEQAIF